MDAAPAVSLRQQVADFLTGEGWAITAGEQPPAVYFVFQSGDLAWECAVRVNEELQRVVCYSIPRLNVPAERRAEAMDYLTRANYGLPLGNFEIDLDDGEVRFKTSLAFAGQPLTPTLLKHLVYSNVVTVSKYLPGLLGVVYGDMDPVEAVTRAEQVDPHD